jgi:N4-gp56 family major capsid protein
MSRSYNNPAGGTESSVSGANAVQIRTDHYYKKALIEAQKERYFGNLADVRSMPKNMGKTIKQFHYLPLLDDGNINDQGLDAAGASYVGGNLYGSSKDVGNISGKLPTLSETGGRVNRVGFKRVQLEGSIEKFGFFDEYTQESLDFDTDAELDMHISREMIMGANEITEDALQIDLLNSAGVERFAGTATSDATITPSDLVTYDDLVKLNITLDNNRTPKQSKVITGSRNVDTKVISAARAMYVGTELMPTLKQMVDYHGNPAFVEVKHYAVSGNTMTGEVGSVDNFRIIVVPEMMKWEGAGAAGNASSYETGGKVDIFPMLVVGDTSFTTVGFQTDGKTVKFTITHKKPGTETADRTDPYGETGFMSIKWYYGFMILRSERLALIKTAAKA